MARCNTRGKLRNFGYKARAVFAIKAHVNPWLVQEFQAGFGGTGFEGEADGGVAGELNAVLSPVLDQGNVRGGAVCGLQFSLDFAAARWLVRARR